MKIGILGGSFNPPHLTHYKMAQKLIENRLVDKIYVLPTNDDYNKPNLIDLKHRVNMLETMFKDFPEVSIFVSQSQNFNYTYKALDYFQKENPEDQIYFVMGSDNLKDLPNWRNVQHLIEKYSFIVVLRNDDKISELNNIFPNAKIKFLKDINALSSTKIRNMIKQGIFDQELLDKNVIEYIKKNNLYK